MYTLKNIPGALFALAAALIIAVPGVAEAQVMNMQAAVTRALEANPGMQAARHDLMGAEAGRKSARGAFLPSASMTYGYTKQDHKKTYRDNPTSDDDFYAATLNVHQDLFTGFRVLSTYQKAELTRESTEHSVKLTELTLISTVQQNFLALLKAREDVRLAKDSVKRLEEQLKVTNAFYDVGLKPRLDVLQAEVDLASAQNSLIQAENAVATQIARLNTLLDMDLDAGTDYEGNLEYMPFTMTLEDAIGEALANRPDLLVAQKAVEIAMKNKKIADSAFYPSVGADFDWSTRGDTPAAAGSDFTKTEYSSWSASVGLSWEFWSWGETYYASEQADQSVQSLIQTALNSKQDALYEVKANHLAIRKAEQSIKVNRKAVEAAREGYRMAVARYQAQVGTNTDVLDAQESLTSAEAGLTAALADYEIALSNFYVSIGRKNEALVSN